MPSESEMRLAIARQTKMLKEQGYSQDRAREKAEKSAARYERRNKK